MFEIIWLWTVEEFGSLLLSSDFLSTSNKTDRHDITEIVLKVALNTTTLTLI
jgi:hypothetical protein